MSGHFREVDVGFFAWSGRNLCELRRFQAPLPHLRPQASTQRAFPHLVALSCPTPKLSEERAEEIKRPSV